MGKGIFSSQGQGEKGKWKKGKADSGDSHAKKTFRADKIDLAIMSAMTLVYLIIAVLNLGSTKVPQTYWKPEEIGEAFIVNFDREYQISKLAYYDGVGMINFKIEYLSDSGEFIRFSELNIEAGYNLRWQTHFLQAKTKALRFIVDLPGGTLNEIVLFDKDNDKPVKISSITKQYINRNSVGEVENLFDEQIFDNYEYNYMNSSYFDEIYHPRTAFENINRMEPHETSHPPLGKLIIALGVAIFGMSPFGWRIMGTLFGAAMIPLMYMFGRKVFYGRIYGFIGAFLMMFDFMHFAQTRIGTIDSYPTFFVILSYYFTYDSFINKSYKVGLKKSLIPLLLAGIFWGLGSASKWTAVYAGGGLAVLYFTSRIKEFIDYKKALSKEGSKDGVPSWTESFIRKSIVIPTLCCVVFFVIIPAAIYIMSYLPIITLPGPGHNFEEILRYQENMYGYHSDLDATHPYASTAATWPWVKQPLYEYKGTNIPAGKISVIWVLGNPAVFWFGFICVFAAFVIGTFKSDKRVVPLLVAFAFQYLPWFFIDRCLFIYHFFTATPFMMLCTVFVLYHMMESFPIYLGDIFMNKNAVSSVRSVVFIFIISYLVITAALFVLFYPAMSGMVVDEGYLKYVQWLGVRY
ncbi:MAG: phospholipid carrier-dependent glycosyltransferase [Clostridiaceae bacterium]|nr:phospholipid carrier-dependent glycosyltransferase [Clostridiaceae bacterium]